MLGLFKKKTELEVLQKQFIKLMQDAYEQSKVNRMTSDKMYLEAENVMKRIEYIKSNQ